MYFKVSINEIRLKHSQRQSLILKDINFLLSGNGIYTILGENGSGKSTLIKSITALLPENQYQIDGKVIYNDYDLLNLNESELKEIRKNKIRYVFQDPVNSFDPLKKIGYYFNSPVYNINDIEILLDYFLLPGYNEISEMYPYQISGGMAQRLSVILAFAANPELIILDEPTSGIDYALMNLTYLKLKEFVRKKDNSVLLVTQEWEFASRISDYISLLSEKTMSDFLPATEFFQQRIPSAQLLMDTYRNLKS